MAGHGLREGPRCCMVIRQALYMMIKRVQACSGKYSGLPPAAA